MAAPSWVSSTVTDFGSDATAHAANMPASGVVAGDALIAIVSMDQSCTITTPSGWTLIVAFDSTFTTNTSVYAKIALGTENGTTVDWTTNAVQRGSIHVIQANTWCGNLNGVFAAVTSGFTSSPQIGMGMSAATDVLWINAQAKSSVTGWLAGPPTGYSNDNKTGAGEDTTASASIASGTKAATAVTTELVTTTWTTGTGFDEVLIGIMPVGFIGATGLGGATPTYQSTTVTDFGADATSHAANMPATVVKDDLLIALVSMDTAATTITTPSGWTLFQANNVSAGMVTSVYAKVAIGTEGGTTVNWVTSNVQRGSVHVIRVSAWATSLRGVRVAIGGSSASTAMIGFGAGAVNYNTLWMAAQAKSSVTAWGGSPPTNYTNSNTTGVGEDLTTSASIASGTRATTANSETVGTAWTVANQFDYVMVQILPSGTFPQGGTGTGGKGKGGGKGGGNNGPPPKVNRTFGTGHWRVDGRKLW